MTKGNNLIPRGRFGMPKRATGSPTRTAIPARNFPPFYDAPLTSRHLFNDLERCIWRMATRHCHDAKQNVANPQKVQVMQSLHKTREPRLARIQTTQRPPINAEHYTCHASTTSSSFCVSTKKMRFQNAIHNIPKLGLKAKRKKNSTR